MALDESKIRFIKLIVASLGIFISFFVFGIFQERITRVTYGEGEDVEKFSYFQPMIGFLTFFYYIVAQGRCDNQTSSPFTFTSAWWNWAEQNIS